MAARDTIEVWNDEATTFDDAADHGLRDPEVRAAWRELLLSALPPSPATVADLGSGTGTLSLLLAEEGYAVAGVDLSPAMVRRARAKAATHPARADVAFVQGDAAQPPLSPGSYDVVLCRHVLWAMPDPATALARWIALLQPGGRLVLVEGQWSTGAGLTSDQTMSLVESTGRPAELRMLAEPQLWGRETDDERYLVVSA